MYLQYSCVYYSFITLFQMKGWILTEVVKLRNKVKWQGLLAMSMVAIKPIPMFMACLDHNLYIYRISFKPAIIGTTNLHFIADCPLSVTSSIIPSSKEILNFDSTA